MKKETLALILISMLLLVVYIPVASAHDAPFPADYDSTHLWIETICDPESLDPAWAYDAASGEVIQNVYETLISLRVEWEDGPHQDIRPGKSGAGKIDDPFIPTIASELPTIDYSTTEINPKTGEPYYSTWYFPIRTGVHFHNGWGTLTPADVEYSFEREMVMDRSAGPQWMLFEPLLGAYYATTDLTDPYGADGIEINNAVKSNSTHAWFNLVGPYPELAFKQILCQSWASVVCKAWAISRGDFDGDWSKSWHATFNKWHNPAVSHLDAPIPDMVGTGPYQFSFWNRQVDYSIVYYPDYWQGWPAPSKALGGTGTDLSIYNDLPHTLGGYLEEVTWKVQTSLSRRIGNFLNGLSDMTYVPRFITFSMVGQSVGGERIRCYYPVRPMLTLDAFFFTFDISARSEYCGVMQPHGTFSTAGIPPDIFSDINVRRGFAYAFDYADWLKLAMLDEGTQPADPVVPGLAYDNPENSKYYLDMAKKDYYLKLSWGGVDARSGIPGVIVYPEDPAQVTPGDLWNGGMKMSVTYNIGNELRYWAALEICNEINSNNPSRFFLKPEGLDWTRIQRAMMASELPLFLMGWSADFADPHDFVFPFQHSLGTFSQWQRYGNPVADALIQAGIATPDDPGGETAYNAAGRPLDYPDPRPHMTNWYESTNKQDYIDNPIDANWPRRAIYYALQAYYHDDIPSVPLVQPIGRHWEQAWVRGWYYNPLYGGSLTPGIDSTGPSTPTLYVYHLWKAKTHFGDVNSIVGDPDDYAYGKPDEIVGGADLAYIAAHYTPVASTFGYHVTADINGGIGATTGGSWGFVRGMPDGNVDIIDIGLANAYWDNPKGPSHPP